VAHVRPTPPAHAHACVRACVRACVLTVRACVLTVHRPARPRSHAPHAGYKGAVPPPELRSHPMLFDLAADPGERHDLASTVQWRLTRPALPACLPACLAHACPSAPRQLLLAAGLTSARPRPCAECEHGEAAAGQAPKVHRCGGDAAEYVQLPREEGAGLPRNGP
jgi:hypothetical protein